MEQHINQSIITLEGSDIIVTKERNIKNFVKSRRSLMYTGSIYL